LGALRAAGIVLGRLLGVTDRAKVFAKELYDAKLLSEEGWERVDGENSPKVLTQ